MPTGVSMPRSGIKLNGSLKVIVIVATLVALIVGVGIAWGNLNGRVTATEDDISDVKKDVRVIREDVKELLKRVPKKK